MEEERLNVNFRGHACLRWGNTGGGRRGDIYFSLFYTVLTALLARGAGDSCSLQQTTKTLRDLRWFPAARQFLSKMLQKGREFEEVAENVKRKR